MNYTTTDLAAFTRDFDLVVAQKERYGNLPEKKEMFEILLGRLTDD